MRRLATAIGLLLVLASGFSQADEPGRLCGDRHRIRKVLIEVRERLAELRGMSATHPDYMTRRDMTRKVDRLRRLLDRLDAELSVRTRPSTRPQPVVRPMEAGRFQALLQALAAESFAKGRQRVLRQAVGHNHFTVAQVRQVMRQFSFADGKVQAAAAMYPRLVDPQNFHLVYEELSFDADKDKLRQLVSH